MCARPASRSGSSTRTTSWRARRSSAGPSSWSSSPTGAPASATDRMKVVERHPYEADARFDGGDLDCGNGLLLLIRQHLDPLERGQLLEFRSTEISVDEDFPAWCRMTGNELVSFVKRGQERSFLVCKGMLAERRAASARARPAAPITRPVVPVTIPSRLPAPAPAPPIAPLAVMGIGSWPRPRWMLQA